MCLIPGAEEVRCPSGGGVAGRALADADDQTGLKQVSYAMTEQVRAMSDQRAGRQLGKVSDETLTAISRYLHLFIV
jgi:mRNA-degrading endonuclease toxin of MazEF toxin-antitoxin module